MRKGHLGGRRQPAATSRKLAPRVLPDKAADIVVHCSSPT
jgi:hypothetical protein